MKTTAIRLYGKKDLRMETFELPQIKDDEILAKEAKAKLKEVKDKYLGQF